MQLVNPPSLNKTAKTIRLSILVSFSVLLIYRFTLSPTVNIIDSGELITGCYLLDILHPTGYPLYTLIGNIFSKIPIASIAQRINFISAIYCTAASCFFFLLLFGLTNSVVAALVSTSLFAFSRTIWSVAVGAEVYGLTALFLVLIVYLWLKVEKNNILILLAFILGMSFTNHMMIWSTFIGTGIFMMLFYRKNLFCFRYLMIGMGFFLLGLSVYLYLLIRARGTPLFNWGNPYNWERLVWHVTGKQYRVWMFSSSWAEVFSNLKFALNLFLKEGFYIFIIPAILGVVKMVRNNFYLFISLLIIFILTLFYAINYSIPDIESYYIPCLFVMFVFAGFGLAILIKNLRVNQYFFLIFIILPLLFNYRRAGMQGNYLAYDSAINHLKSAPVNAIILTNWWDIYAPVFYVQHIENIRKDVCIIDKELLRRSWYLQYLNKQYPWLVRNCQIEIEYFLSYLEQFEHGRLQENVGIQNAFVDMINSFIDRNPNRRVFITFADQADYDAKFIKPERRRIPYGLLYELSSDTIVESFDYGQFSIRKPNLILDERTNLIIKRYENLGLERTLFLKKHGKIVEAKKTLEWILKVNPDSRSYQKLFSTLKLSE